MSKEEIPKIKQIISLYKGFKKISKEYTHKEMRLEVKNSRTKKENFWDKWMLIWQGPAFYGLGTYVEDVPKELEKLYLKNLYALSGDIKRFEEELGPLKEAILSGQRKIFSETIDMGGRKLSHSVDELISKNVIGYHILGPSENTSRYTHYSVAGTPIATVENIEPPKSDLSMIPDIVKILRGKK